MGLVLQRSRGRTGWVFALWVLSRWRPQQLEQLCEGRSCTHERRLTLQGIPMCLLFITSTRPAIHFLLLYFFLRRSSAERALLASCREAAACARGRVMRFHATHYALRLTDDAIKLSLSRPCHQIRPAVPPICCTFLVHSEQQL